MNKIQREFVLIVGLSLLAGVLTFWLHPRAPDWHSSRLADGAVRMADVPSENVLWVDARAMNEYEEAHIPGAVWLSEDAWEEGLDNFFMEWDPAMTVVVYCGGGACQASKAVMERLKREIEVKNIYFLEGGIDAWQQLFGHSE